jgi:hypothetical protein
MLRILSLIALVYTFAACSSGDAGTTENHEGHDHSHEGHDHDHDHGDEENTEEGDGVHFGVEITPEGAIGLADMLEKVEAGEGAVDLDLGEENMVKAVAAKVEGQVSDVCKKAGCWLKIASDDGKEMFILTNHEFVVPVDIVGKTVAVDGSGYKSVTSVDERRHYAEDEGETAKEIAKITEPITEYKFLAKGLVIK